MSFYGNHFKTDGYIVLKFGHHTETSTVHLYAKLYGNIFHHYLTMHFHCKNTYKHIYGKLSILRLIILLILCPEHISGIFHTSYGTPSKSSIL